MTSTIPRAAEAGRCLTQTVRWTGTWRVGKGGPVRSCYLGPAYPEFTPAMAPRPGLAARQLADPARYLAAQMAVGKIAGLFQGRLEAGPRALGNRSILASPLLPDVTARLNAAVKFREPR